MDIFFIPLSFFYVSTFWAVLLSSCSRNKTWRWKKYFLEKIWLYPCLDVFFYDNYLINRLSRRKRGMASNPLFIKPDFFCILVLLNWDSQQGRPFFLPSQRNFPVSFKTKVALAKFIGKMQKKSGIMKSGLDAMPLFLLPRRSVK